MVINTNTDAMRNANTLNASQANLARALARLSSGDKIVYANDDAAGLAVSDRLTAQITRLDSAASNVINAVSFAQTQDGYLKTVSTSLRRMGELAMLAQDTSKSTADIELYDKEFQQLIKFINATKSQNYNSASLFSSATMAVTIDSEGTTFGMPPIDMSVAGYDNAITVGANAVDIQSAANAADAVAKVKTAITQVATDRATLGSVLARLNFTRDQLSVTKENLSAAVSRIRDVDVADESTKYARWQILVQSGTQMLRQANQLPAGALQLLQ
jgi:flagellin